MATFLITENGAYINVDCIERVEIVEGIAYVFLAAPGTKELDVLIPSSRTGGFTMLGRQSYYKIEAADWLAYLAEQS